MTLDFIQKSALSCGFNLCGSASCREKTEHKKFLQNYLDNSYNAGLGYLERNFEKRLDPRLLVPGAKSIIVCAVSHNNMAWKEQKNSNYKIASYALAKDYHISIKKMLNELLTILKSENPEIKARVFVDTAPILEKAWAVEAGLGWIGKNSLLITPEFGSFINLGEIVLDIELEEYSEPYINSHCGNCTRCIDNCPNSAIRAPKIVDARRCISRLTVERNVGDCEADYPTHDWLFGCDMCQCVCPFNEKAKTYTNIEFAPVIEPTKLSTQYIESMNNDDFIEIFKDTPMNQKR